MIAKLLNVKAVSEILCCSVPQIYKLVEAEKLCSVNISAESNGKKKGVRFTESEIKRFIEDNSK